MEHVEQDLHVRMDNVTLSDVHQLHPVLHKGVSVAPSTTDVLLCHVDHVQHQQHVPHKDNVCVLLPLHVHKQNGVVELYIMDVKR